MASKGTSSGLTPVVKPVAHKNTSDLTTNDETFPAASIASQENHLLIPSDTDINPSASIFSQDKYRTVPSAGAASASNGLQFSPAQPGGALTSDTQLGSENTHFSETTANLVEGDKLCPFPKNSDAGFALSNTNTGRDQANVNQVPKIELPEQPGNALRSTAPPVIASTTTSSDRIVASNNAQDIPAEVPIEPQYQVINQRPSKHNSRPKRLYQCCYPTCLRIFEKVSNVKAHWRVHNNHKPFKCKYCEHQYKWVSSMRAHEVKHLKDDNGKKRKTPLKSSAKVSVATSNCKDRSVLSPSGSAMEGVEPQVHDRLFEAAANIDHASSSPQASAQAHAGSAFNKNEALSSAGFSPASVVVPSTGVINGTTPKVQESVDTTMQDAIGASFSINENEALTSAGSSPAFTDLPFTGRINGIIYEAHNPVDTSMQDTIGATHDGSVFENDILDLTARDRSSYLESFENIDKGILPDGPIQDWSFLEQDSVDNNS